MGISVASAGDVNGDGYADVIVGAHLYDAGQTDEGAAFVFLGSRLRHRRWRPRRTAHAQLESDQVDADMGWSVASAGDVNGDGYADVIVGAPVYDAGQTDEGRGLRVPRLAPRASPMATPRTAYAQLECDQASADRWATASPRPAT